MVPIVFRYLFRLLFLLILLLFRNVLESNVQAIGSFYSILHSIVEFLVFFTIINIGTAMLVMVYRLRKNIPYKFTDNVINGINNIYYISVTFGVLIMIIGFWGIDFKDLLTSLSIVAAAIAIISKDFVSSIISGIIISFSKEINIDDYVKIGENKGKIIDIHLSKVSLLNDDDDIIFIPNDRVYMSEIINYTKKEIKKVSIEFELDVKYLTTIEDLENTLASALYEFNEYIDEDSYKIKVVDVHFEYLSLKFQYMLKVVNHDIEKMIRKKTIRLIANSLKTK